MKIINYLYLKARNYPQTVNPAVLKRIYPSHRIMNISLIRRMPSLKGRMKIITYPMNQGQRV